MNLNGYYICVVIMLVSARSRTRSRGILCAANKFPLHYVELYLTCAQLWFEINGHVKPQQR